MALKGRLAWRALVTVGSGCKRLDDCIDDKCFLWQKGTKFRCIVFIRSFRIVFPSLVRVCAGPCTHWSENVTTLCQSRGILCFHHT